ncbi:MAG: hypothetical protein SGCHY_003938 [Lobulomycetales sp.]
MPLCYLGFVCGTAVCPGRLRPALCPAAKLVCIIPAPTNYRGLTFVRLLVPWESLEHAGPGIYDTEFISYLILVLKKAAAYGIVVFIDPHQDTWSRFSGGSGAPGWTFEVIGLDLTKFKATGASHIHQLLGEDESEDRGNIALWATNYTKLACATAMTVFFAGNTFAPRAKYQGHSLQDFLQNAFLKCYANLAKCFKEAGVTNVIGFEVMNEPHPGYVDLPRISDHFDQNSNLNLGASPSALQSFAAGDGIPQTVDYWVKTWPRPTRRSGTTVINPHGESAWLDGRPCIWRQHGVWDIDPTTGAPHALVDTYFTRDPKTGCRVDFLQDFYMPFVKTFATAVRAADPALYIFFEPVPNEYPPVVTSELDDESYVYSPHWYDLKTMFEKQFNGVITHDVQGLSKKTRSVLDATYFGLGGANRNYRLQVSNVVAQGQRNVGPKPTVIGECGVPMDINGKSAFQSGDYTHHRNFLDAVINAMDASLVNFTLWNYNPDNTQQHGDHWNGEDFSIYSRKVSMTPVDSMASGSPTTPVSPFDITREYFEGERSCLSHSGGRVLDAIIRPYAAKIAGEPKLMKFNLDTLEFRLEFATRFTSVDPPDMSLISEIFVPNFHYGDFIKRSGKGALQITVSDGSFLLDHEKQTLYWKYDPEYMKQVVNGDRVLHTLVVRVPELQPKQRHWRWEILLALFAVAVYNIFKYELASLGFSSGSF